MFPRERLAQEGGHFCELGMQIEEMFLQEHCGNPPALSNRFLGSSHFTDREMATSRSLVSNLAANLRPTFHLLLIWFCVCLILYIPALPIRRTLDRDWGIGT